MLLILENLKAGWIVTRKETFEARQPEGNEKMPGSIAGTGSWHGTPLFATWPHSPPHCLSRRRREKGKGWGRDQMGRPREKCGKKNREKARERKRGKSGKMEEVQQHQYFLKCEFSSESQEKCVGPLPVGCLVFLWHCPWMISKHIIHLVDWESVTFSWEYPPHNGQDKFRIIYSHLFHLY